MDVYENAMVEARVAFTNRINKLVSGASTDQLGFFIIYYAALGAALHGSMAKMMEKTSQRCRDMNAELSGSFSAQAHFEGAQSQEMKNDAKTWVDWWSNKRDLTLSAKEYLRHPMMPSMQAFDDLYKDILEQKQMYAEVGMVYEMLRSNAVHSFTLIKLTIFKLGLSALRHLGFVRHAAKASANSPLNKEVLSQFLKQHPEALPVMLDKARAALSVYADFLEDCFQLSENEAKKYQLVKV